MDPHWFIHTCQNILHHSPLIQMLPPPLPAVFPPLLLISSLIRKNSSISFCRLVFLRSASALALSMFRILISATLWLRLCCSRLSRRTETCLSRTSLLRSSLQPTDTREDTSLNHTLHFTPLEQKSNDGHSSTMEGIYVKNWFILW